MRLTVSMQMMFRSLLGVSLPDNTCFALVSDTTIPPGGIKVFHAFAVAACYPLLGAPNLARHVRITIWKRTARFEVADILQRGA